MAMTSWHAVDSDDEFENDAEAGFSGKTALLVVIDVSPTMFKGWEENEETPYLAAMKCCEAMWRSKIVSNANDLVSLLFVGSETSKNPSSFPNLYQLQELSSVTVDMIKQLIAMNSLVDLDAFNNEIGSSESYDLKDLFWLAKIVFDEGKTQTFLKKIMYFTCEDNPHAGKRNLQQDVIKKFKDLGKVDFNIITFKEDFQFDKFYSQILDDQSSVIYSKDLNRLMKVVHMKQKLKRPVSRSTLQIVPGLKLAIGYYSFVRPAQAPKYVYINKRNNEVVEKVTTASRSDTGMPILKSEECKLVAVQGEQAVFTPDEVKDFKNSTDELGITVIGFMNNDCFDSFAWYRSPPYFIYPDEERISGSKDLFTLLLNRCHLLEKVVLVRMITSRASLLKLACMIPCVPDDETKAVFPQGFHVFPIPFSDEMRKYEMEPGPEASPELLSAMEQVVKKLTNKAFNNLDVKNPGLQFKWKNLEEEALEEKFQDKEEFYDYTEPNEQLMKNRLGTLPLQIDQEVQEFDSMVSTAPMIREKARVDVKMEAKHGRLEKCTVVVLKEFLDANGIKTFNRKKADLISDVKKFLKIVD